MWECVHCFQCLLPIIWPRRVDCGSLLLRRTPAAPCFPVLVRRRGFLLRRSPSLSFFLSFSLAVSSPSAVWCASADVTLEPFANRVRRSPACCEAPVAFAPRVQMSLPSFGDQHQPVPRSRVDTNTREKSRGDRNGETKKKVITDPTRKLPFLLKLCWLRFARPRDAKMLFEPLRALPEPCQETGSWVSQVRVCYCFITYTMR